VFVYVRVQVFTEEGNHPHFHLSRVSGVVVHFKFCLVYYRLGRQFSSDHTFSFMLLVVEKCVTFTILAKNPPTVCCKIETQSTVTLYNLLYSIVLEHCVVC